MAAGPSDRSALVRRGGLMAEERHHEPARSAGAPRSAGGRRHLALVAQPAHETERVGRLDGREERGVDGLHRADRAGRQPLAARRDADAPGAGVGGIGRALQQPLGLQRTHDLRGQPLHRQVPQARQEAQLERDRPPGAPGPTGAVGPPGPTAPPGPGAKLLTFADAASPTPRRQTLGIVLAAY